MRIPIKATREFAKKHGITHIVIYGYDGKQQHVATWGKSIEDCAAVAEWGNKLKDALGWPESLHAEPSRVRKLRHERNSIRAEMAKMVSELHLLLNRVGLVGFGASQEEIQVQCAREYINTVRSQLEKEGHGK